MSAPLQNIVALASLRKRKKLLRFQAKNTVGPIQNGDRGADGKGFSAPLAPLPPKSATVGVNLAPCPLLELLICRYIKLASKVVHKIDIEINVYFMQVFGGNFG